MKRFWIEKQAYDLPTCWDEVTYSQYVALLTTQDSLPGFLSLFTGLSTEFLNKANINSAELAWKTLSFLTIPPVLEKKPSLRIGPYASKESSINNVVQFEDLQQLFLKTPPRIEKKEDTMLAFDLYLTACAIYVQKIKHGSYDRSKIDEVKEELRQYSSIEVLQTGGFFLFRAFKLQPHQLN